MNTPSKKPWIAVFLSLLAMGVGHLYCGRNRRGFALYTAWFIIPLCGFLAAWLPRSAGVLVAFICIPVIMTVVLYAFAAWDAFRQARGADDDAHPNTYRAGVYVALVAAQLLIPSFFLLTLKETTLQGFRIPVDTMAPNLLRGDRVLVNKQGAPPQRGDVIAYRNPTEQGGQVFLGRIVAVGGDFLSIDGASLAINGEPVPQHPQPRSGPAQRGDVFEEVLGETRYQVTYNDFSTAPHRPTLEVTVPAQSVFVMADNRDRARDSREFGPIARSEILGPVEYIYYPALSWDRFGLFRGKTMTTTTPPPP